MSRTYRKGGINHRKPTITANHRYKKLGRAIVYLTQAQQEKEARQLISVHPSARPVKRTRQRVK
jgi:hypothetical protein